MAFPTVAGTNTTNGTTASANAAINYPTVTGGIKAGMLLIAFVRSAVAGAHGYPSAGGGWTELFDGSPDAADDQTSGAWRLADGSETGTFTVTITSSKFCACTFAVSGHESPTVRAPEFGTQTTGSATEPNAGTVTPTGGAKDYLWITMYSMEGEQTGVTTYPANYSSNQLFANSGTTGAVTTNCTMGAASRTNNAASEDAGVWDVTGTLDDWNATTVAVHPADVRTLGWRGRYADAALNGLERPTLSGGMTPACIRLPDTLTGFRRAQSGLYVPKRYVFLKAA